MANVPRHTQSRRQAQPAMPAIELKKEPGEEVFRMRRPNMGMPLDPPTEDAKDALMRRLEEYNKKAGPRVPRYVPREYQGE